MIPDFAGYNLPPGVHSATWAEFVQRFGYTPYRLALIRGLHTAIVRLREAGCRLVYVDGSFVSRKTKPADYDCCWDPDGVRGIDLRDRHRMFLNDRADARAKQKLLFSGEFFQSNHIELQTGLTYLEFLQKDKKTNKPKGIVLLDTAEVPDDFNP